MRVLVSADIHLGSPIRSVAMRNPELGERLKQASRKAFIRIVDLAISENVDVQVLAGDIFDNDQPDLKSRAFLISQLARAADAGIPTLLIRGNHDALLDNRVHGTLGPNMHLLHKDVPSVEIDGVWFHGLSFDKTHMSKSFLPDYPAPVPGQKNVGLMHTSLDGSPEHDPYAPCSEQDLMAHGYDLWCLGHIHAPFERSSGSILAVMPGIPQPRHFGERAGGSVAIVTLGDGAPVVTRHQVAQLKFTECALDLTDCADDPEILKLFRDAFENIRDDEYDTALRLQLTAHHHKPDMLAALASEVLDNIDRVFIDKVKVSPPKRQIESKTDDLMRLMREEVQQPGFRHAGQQILEELRDVLPREIRDDLAEEAFDTLLEEAVNDVLLSLHARGEQ